MNGINQRTQVSLANLITGLAEDAGLIQTEPKLGEHRDDAPLLMKLGRVRKTRAIIGGQVTFYLDFTDACLIQDKVIIVDMSDT